MIFVIYIKLEEDMDKFMSHFNVPRSLKKLMFKAKCRNGKFALEKIDDMECLVVPEINERMLKKLKILADIRCWKNICVSNRLLENPDFLTFASTSSLKVMDGRWLFKNIIDQVVEFIAETKHEKLENKEISILCNKLDDTMMEKIKELCVKVKVCNILTSQMKQFQKMEQEIYRNHGVILNISSNYKKALLKSSMIINFDFSKKDLEKKCMFAKDSILINVKEDVAISKKYWEGKNITFFEMDLPEKYETYKEQLEGFDSSILYESLIYKNTNYRNIKKELAEDDAKILCLLDVNGEKMKNLEANLPKTLDKIVI